MIAEKADLILAKTSSELVSDKDNVLKCNTIPDAMKNYYLVSIQPFLDQHVGTLKLSRKTEERMKNELIIDALHGADFYSFKAMEFFTFFGINFGDPPKSEVIKPEEGTAHGATVDLLYDSVLMLYVILWEAFSKFLRPLERLYYFRLSHSGVFPEKYQLFPYASEPERIELDFVQHMMRSGTLYRISESLPYELRLACKASPYFKKCFDEGRKKTQALQTEEFIDNFIRLFRLRNDVCHLGGVTSIHKESEDIVQSLLHDLATLLPKVQDSCIGVICTFEQLAKEEK